MAKVVQEDSSIPQESGGIGCMFSHIPKLHYDWRFHGVCAICHVYPWLAKPFDNEQLGSTLWKCFLSHGNFLSQLQQPNLENLRYDFLCLFKRIHGKDQKFQEICQSVSNSSVHCMSRNWIIWIRQRINRKG